MDSLRSAFRGSLWPMAETGNRDRVSQQVLLANLWLALLSLAVKIWIGWETRSLMLLAESLHTVIDAFSTVLSLIAVLLPYRHNGREVWSHGRLESSLALFLVSLLGFGGLGLASLALTQLTASPSLAHLPRLTVTPAMIQVLALVCMAQVALAIVQNRQAQRFSSLALGTNAQHFLKDAWLLVVLLVALLGLWQGYSWLDPLVTIAMVITAGLSCWRVLDIQLPLMLRQIAIAPEAISQIVRQVQGVTHCHQIRSRGVVGRQVWIDLRIVLHPEFHSASNWVKQQIEANLRDRYGPVQVSVEIDAIDSEPIYSQDQPKRNPDREFDGR